MSIDGAVRAAAVELGLGLGDLLLDPLGLAVVLLGVLGVAPGRFALGRGARLQPP
jgi:hypothetical protein